MGQDSTFFRGILGKMQSKDLKTVRGTRAKRRVPRTVLRSEDCNFPRDPKDKGGVLSLYPGYAGLCHVFQSVMYLGKQYSQDAMFSELIFIVLFSNIRPVLVVNQHNQGIMIRLHLFPWDLW